MMKTASWATLAALMWSGAAFAAGEENLEVQSTNLTLDFEGRAVLYTIQNASTIVVAQYVTSDANEVEGDHDYDTVNDFNDKAGTITAGWRGCSGAGMCVDTSLTGADGAGTSSAGAGAEQSSVYTNAVRNGPGDWHTEGVVSDHNQVLTGYVQECNAAFSTCGVLNAGSRLIWVNDTVKYDADKNAAITTFSGTINGAGASTAGDGASEEFVSTAGSGAPIPAEDNTLAAAPAASGAFQKPLYDFAQSGEFQVWYDVVVELSVKHQDDGTNKYFKLFQTIWGNDNDGNSGAVVGAAASATSTLVNDGPDATN